MSNESIETLTVQREKAIVKTSEKSDLWTAIDIGSVWLKKALKEAAKPQ